MDNKQQVDWATVLNEFDDELNRLPNTTDEQLFEDYPEFNNDKTLLEAAFAYRNTKAAKKYDDATLKSKFPEFFPAADPASVTATTQQQAAPTVTAQQTTTATTAQPTMQLQPKKPVAQTAQDTVSNPYDGMTDEDLQAREQSLIAMGGERKKQLLADAQKKPSGLAGLFYNPAQSISAVQGLSDEEAMSETDKKVLKALRDEIGRRAASIGFDAEIATAQAGKERVQRAAAKSGGDLNLSSAKYLYEKAEEILSAPSKFDDKTGFDSAWQGIKNFGEGTAENLFDRQFFATADLQRNIRLSGLVKKLNSEDELSDSEAEFLNAYVTLVEAQQKRANDLSLGYKIGQGAAESAPFMVDMLLTSGISSLGKKAVVRNIAKKYGKDVAGKWAKWLGGSEGVSYAESLAKDVNNAIPFARKFNEVVVGAKLTADENKTLARLEALEAKKITLTEAQKTTLNSLRAKTATTSGDVGRYITRELVETPVQTATMASSWAGVFEDKANYMLGTGETDWDTKDAFRSFGNMYVETLTERAGGKLIDMGLDKVLPISKIWGKRKGSLRVANDYIQSPISETAEEYLGAGINYIRSFNPFYSDESNKELRDEAAQMMTLEGFAQTFGTVLPMSLLGGAYNVTNVWYNTYAYNSARNKITQYLVQNGATPEQAENIMATMEGAETPEQFDDFLSKTVNNLDEITSGNDHHNIRMMVQDYGKAAYRYNLSVDELSAAFASLSPEEQKQAKAEMSQVIVNLRHQGNVKRTEEEQQRAGIHEDGNIYFVTLNENDGEYARVVGGDMRFTTDDEGRIIIDEENSGEILHVKYYDMDEHKYKVKQVAPKDIVDVYNDGVSAQSVIDASVAEKDERDKQYDYFPEGSTASFDGETTQIVGNDENGVTVETTAGDVTVPGDVASQILTPEDGRIKIRKIGSDKEEDTAYAIPVDGGYKLLDKNGKEYGRVIPEEELFGENGLGFEMVDPQAQPTGEVVSEPTATEEPAPAAEPVAETAPEWEVGENGVPVFDKISDPDIMAKAVLSLAKDKEKGKRFINDVLIPNAEEAHKVAKAKKAKKPTNWEEFQAAEALAAEVNAAQGRIDMLKKAALALTNMKSEEELAAEAAKQAELAAQLAARAQTEEGAADTKTMKGRYDAAAKVVGHNGTTTLADGTELAGHYVLISPSGLSASHNAASGFDMTEGYPTVDGQSINDRDYKKDVAEQNKVRQAAANYDGRAIKNVPVISNEGLVYNGNGRTMAGQLAAANGTDAAYTQSLKANAAQFGFTEEQIDAIPNARVVFQLNENLPYNTTSLAIFNANETQSQSLTSLAAAITRKMTPAGQGHIIGAIQDFDTIDDFFKSKAPFELINNLISDGIISQSDKAAMIENEKLTAGGREVLTAVMFGTAFSEDVVRLLGDNAKVKNNVLKALPQILENKGLADFSIFDEINNAIKAVYQMEQAGLSFAEFTRQMTIEGTTAASQYGEFELILAQRMMSDEKKGFANLIASYNEKAKAVAGGQLDMFSEGMATKQDIIDYIVNLVSNKNEQAEENGQKPAASNETDNAPASSEGNGEEVTAPEVETKPIETEKPSEGETETPEVENKPKAEESPKPKKGTYEYYKELFGDDEKRIRQAMRLFEITNKSPKMDSRKRTNDGFERSEKTSVSTAELTEEELREIQLLGIEIGSFFVEQGDVKFADFFRTMVLQFGDNIRGSVKKIYAGIREDASEELYNQMDGSDVVRAFDINQPVNETENGSENDSTVQGSETGTDNTPVADSPEGGVSGEPGVVPSDDGGVVGETGTTGEQPSDVSGEPAEGEGTVGTPKPATTSGGNSGSGTRTGGGTRGGGKRGGRKSDTGTNSGESVEGTPAPEGEPNLGLTEEEIAAAEAEKQKAEDAKNEQEGYDDENKVIKDENDPDKLKARKKEHQTDLKKFDDANQEDSAIRRTINRIKGRIRAINDKLRTIFAKKNEQKTDLTTEKVAYIAKSDPEGHRSVGSVVPSGVAGDIAAAFARLEEEEGKSIVEFAKDELGYETEEEMFCDYTTGKDTGLSGEQVDGVALAIHQMKKKGMFIIGDMTGIGKGREGAAIIRWAKKQGKKVLFVTEKPNLFTDMYGDLKDIGSDGLLPFIVHSDTEANIVDRSNVVEKVDEDGNVTYVPKPIIRKWSAKDLGEYFAKNTDELPVDKKSKKQFDFVMTTYSQAGSGEGAGTAAQKAKLAWLRQYATDAIVIMDESHNASGDSNQGEFFRNIAKDAEGVTFMSATYAKRPDNMLLYAIRSSMSNMNMTNQQLIEAVENYGVPMQEIIASSLFKTGEMIRRERDFTDVKTTWEDPKELYGEKEYETARGTADKTMAIVNQIIEFQEDNVRPLIKALNDGEKEDNAKVDLTGNGWKTTWASTPYSSQVSNVMNLIMYDLKARKAAELAIEQIKRGEKPVIAVENTFGSYIDELGDNLTSADFAAVLEKGLKGSLRYRKVRQLYKDGKKVKKEDGGRVVEEFESIYSQMDGTGKAEYAAAKKAIEDYTKDTDKELMVLSPIDYIKELIAQAGYKCGEITGRNFELVHNADGTYTKVPRKTNKQKEMMMFNGGTAAKPLPKGERSDAIILNVAGATGISLHASSRFGDQSPRTMLILQAARNASIEVQMRGRVDRTGQVARASYYYIVSPIPSEQKQAMMLRKKLASLDANSVGTENVSSNKVDADDMDNKYGDQVAEEYLKEHIRDINDFLGDKGLTRDNKSGEWYGREGLLYDVLVGIQRFPCDEQEQILADLQAKYAEKVEYLVQNGIYDLSSSIMNLDAKTIDTGIFIKGKDNESASMFAHDTNIERVEVNVLKKPILSAEIHKRTKKYGGINEDGTVNTGHAKVILSEVDDAITVSNEAKKKKDEEDEQKLLAKLKEKYPKAKDMTDEEYEKLIKNNTSYTDKVAKHNDEETVLRTNNAKKRDLINYAVSNLEQGKVYLVPLTDEIGPDAPMSYARFLGFDYKSDKPLSMKAVFAVKDSRSTIEIPVVSQEATIRKIVNDTDYDTDYGVNDIPNVKSWHDINANMPGYDDWWDKQIPKNTGRQIRYMVTGNVVQACGNLGKYKGTIVTFTRRDVDTDEVTAERGMLLAEDFDPENFKVRKKPTKEDIWDTALIVKDSINNISARREGDMVVFVFSKRGREQLKNHPINKDDEFKKLISGDIQYNREDLRAYVTEEHLEEILEHLYKNHGFSKEEMFVMPDSSERVDAIVPTGKSYQEVIDELGKKYNVRSKYEAKSEIKKAIKRYKLDINNDGLKERIKELVQLRQAYLRKDRSHQELSRLAWDAIIKEQEIAEAGDYKEYREDAYNNFLAIVEELEFRGVKGHTWHMESGEVPVKEIKKLFDKTNKDKQKQALADRVFALVEKLGFNAIMNEKLSNDTGGQTAGNVLEYNWKYMNAGFITDQMKADTLLHEVIHTVTVYAIRAVNEGYEHMLPAGMTDIINNVNNIYREIRRDAAFTHVDGSDTYQDYGVFNEKEMLTEAGSNSIFQEDLKKVELVLQNRFGVITFLNKGNNPGVQGTTMSAYDAVMECLNFLVDNFSDHAYKEYWKGSRYGSYAYQQYESNQERLEQINTELTRMPIREAMESCLVAEAGRLNKENEELKQIISADEDLRVKTAQQEKAVEDLKTLFDKAGINYVIESAKVADAAKSNADNVFADKDGVVYGWYENVTIHLVAGRVNPNTMVHEYTHMWAAAMRDNNADGWESIKNVLKNTPMWEDVKNDPNYESIKDNDDAIASEVLSRYSGSRGSERLVEEEKKLLAKNGTISAAARLRVLMNDVKGAISKFWSWVGKNLFDIKKFNSVDEIADRVLYDLLNGTNLGPDGPGGGSHQIDYPQREPNESQSDYNKRLKAFVDNMKDINKVRAYVQEVNREIGSDDALVKKEAAYKKWFDAAEPIANFLRYFEKLGGKIKPGMNPYEDMFLAPGRVSTACGQFERLFVRPLAKTIGSLVDSKKLDGIELTWQNLTDDDIKDDEKKRKNGKRLTAREIIGVYAQAKDCVEADEQGLPDRGRDGFLNNVGKTPEEIIEMVESALGKEEIANLWAHINAATSFALDYELKKKFIDKATREKFQERKFYVPERGWRERDMSGAETDYVHNGRLYNQPYNKALRAAEGRSSLASDPFAYIMSIGESSISSAEKNVTLQKFLEYCLNNEKLGLESGAFRIMQTWIVNDIDPETGRVKIDDAGNPITKVSYASPSSKQMEHDKEIHAEINKLTKELGKMKRDLRNWQKMAEDKNAVDVVREAAGRKAEKMQEKIDEAMNKVEDLENQLYVASRFDMDKMDFRTPDEAMQHKVVVVKDGQRYTIWLRNEVLANALNKNYGDVVKDASKTNKALRKGTRLLSALLTQYNPEFALSNFFRDGQVALATLAVEHGAKFAAQATANFVKIQSAVWKYVAAEKLFDEETFANSEYGDYLREYYEHGAQTGYSYLKELDLLKDNFDSMMNEKALSKAFKKFANALSIATEVSETAVRFAAYVTARESGMNADEAAILSKELTTNFDRGGEISKNNAMSLFSFMRATINGNLKFFKGFKRFAKGYSIAAAAYMVMGLLNALINPDDPDDGVWFTDYARESNFTTGAIFGFTAKIPVAHFLRMFFALGNNIGATYNGRKSAEEAAYDTLSFASDELLPNWMNFGSMLTYDASKGRPDFEWENYVQSAAPSVISPIVDVALNRDFIGRSINGEKHEYRGSENKKDIRKHKKDVPKLYLKITEGIYENIFQGETIFANKMDDNAIQRLADNSPSAIQHIVEGYMPGTAAMLIHIGILINEACEGKEVFADDIPFVRKFYSSYRIDKAYASEYWLLNSRVEAYNEYLNSLIKEEDTDTDEITDRRYDRYDKETETKMYELYDRCQDVLYDIDPDDPTTNSMVKRLMEANEEWNRMQ